MVPTCNGDDDLLGNHNIYTNFFWKYIENSGLSRQARLQSKATLPFFVSGHSRYLSLSAMALTEQINFLEAYYMAKFILDSH